MGGPHRPGPGTPGPSPRWRLAAIGPGTGKALAAHGLRPDLVPPVYDSPHLAQALLEQAPEKPLLLLRSDLATQLLPQALSQGGVPWEEVACYRTVFTCPPGGEQARDWVREGAVAAFTSALHRPGLRGGIGGGAGLPQSHRLLHRPPDRTPGPGPGPAHPHRQDRHPRGVGPVHFGRSVTWN